ncbi:36.4 kDa proline-rich protein [Apostasia shenzhenica]|uniref:36.4 kDa proline-rich protein n=1 Tax=Apostasia shenzhenica TaxID=1088818 RepID=A0A2H9ZYP7_9ASPA|nr:36.4 kDa proline-rich protein [Apostasia shenzhenica]
MISQFSSIYSVNDQNSEKCTMGFKAVVFLISFLLLRPPPAISGCIYCSHPAPHRHPKKPPPVVLPPPDDGAPPPVKCSLDILKLGLCLDVLGGLIHVGLAPVESYCCPVLEGLLELEAAACLCTAINLKVLNLNIYIPLALQVLIACGKDPPPGYLCPLRN